MNALVDHPGVDVPETLRNWDVAWPEYRPVDITPPELETAGLPGSVAEGWAEPYELPGDVPDWERRQAEALVPFRFDAHGWPLNPTGRTGRAGRNLGRWGENPAADPVVTAGTGRTRRILLILRKDVRRWAIPGGMVDPGETAPAALVRELGEETGVDLREVDPVMTLHRGYIADWRTTDHAWVCSVAALYQLPIEVPATAGSDAAKARWFPFGDLAELVDAVEAASGLYQAHRPLLAAAAAAPFQLLTREQAERARAALARWYYDESPWEPRLLDEEVANMHAALCASSLDEAERVFGVTDDPLLVSPQQYAENRALLDEIRQHYGS